MSIHPVLLMLYEPDKLDMTHAHYPTRELVTLAPVSVYVYLSICLSIYLFFVFLDADLLQGDKKRPTINNKTASHNPTGHKAKAYFAANSGRRPIRTVHVHY